MRYLALIYTPESTEAPPEGEARQMMADYGAYTEMIKNNGTYLGGEGLQPSSTATTVRVNNGTVSTTDGPFAETKEQLGGFWVIKVTDLDTALEWSAKASAACRAPIEVRPFQEEPEG